MCEQFDPYSFNAAEQQTLERHWTSGELQSRSECIMRFVERHSSEILRLAGENRDPAALIAALRDLIRERGSLDLLAELRDQMHEMEKEIWYRGEKGDYDRARIQREWAEAHACNWRRWRIKEYLYVADHQADVVIARLHQQHSPSHEDSTLL